jgi:N-acetyl-anhydromuramyl-L-alanine amidase AmpD
MPDNHIDKDFIDRLGLLQREYLLNKHRIRIAPLSRAEEYLLQEMWQGCPDEVKNQFPDEGFFRYFLEDKAISELKSLPIFIERVGRRFKEKTITTYSYDESLYEGKGYPLNLLFNITKDWKTDLLKIGRTTQSLMFYGDVRQIEDFTRYPRELYIGRMLWNEGVCKPYFLNPDYERERLKTVYGLHETCIAGLAMLKGEAPCYSDRCDDISRLVIHFTETSVDGVLELFLSRNEREVSAHFIIDVYGNVIHLVELDKRAHHAGRGEFYFENLGNTEGRSLNSMSIGIELVSFGNVYTRAQIRSLIELSKVLLHLSPALNNPKHVLGHQEASLVKLDPGPNFPWLAYLKEVFPSNYDYVINPYSGRRRLRGIFRNPSRAMLNKAKLLGYSMY